MLRGRQIVCLSSLPLAARPTSRLHLARILSRDNEVLFVDPLVNVVRARRVHRGRLHRRDEGFVHLEPPPRLPRGAGPWFPLAARINQRRYAAAVERAVRGLGWDRPVLWTSFPVYASARTAELLHPSVHFLHMTDALWDFPDYRPEYEPFLERITASCDFAVATTPAIAQRLQAYDLAVHHLPHGVDVDRFAPVARQEVEPVPQMQRARRPRVGFVGQLDWRLDVDALVALAQRGSVTLVGPSRLSPSDVQRLRDAGCLLAGEVPYDTLPSWLAGFDVAVLPYRPLPGVEASRPLKLLEYLACGLPVVSVDIPAARELGADIRLTPTPGDLVATVERLWADRPGSTEDPSTRAKRVEVAAAHSWERRAEELSAFVEAAEQQGRPPPRA